MRRLCQCCQSGWRAVGSAVGLGLLILNPWVAASVDAANPDLVVSTLSDPPATARAGDSFSLTAVVTNVVTSPGSVAGASTTKFYLVRGSTKKNLKGVQAIPELAPGAE